MTNDGYAMYSMVNDLVTANSSTPHQQARLALIGHKKDQSTDYLNLFPQWDVINADNHDSISATPIREAILDTRDENTTIDNNHHLPDAVKTTLKTLCQHQDFLSIKEEYAFVTRYRSAWDTAPYTPTFVTVDAVLLQKRPCAYDRTQNTSWQRPTRTTWWLFRPRREINRYLYSRTARRNTLKSTHSHLKKSIKHQQVFDEPYRSARGRTITHAFYIELTPNKDLEQSKVLTMPKKPFGYR